MAVRAISCDRSTRARMYIDIISSLFSLNLFSACRCDDDGSTRDDCDQMSGKCRCKKGVKGAKCTECEKDGSRVNGNACQDAGEDVIQASDDRAGTAGVTIAHA